MEQREAAETGEAFDVTETGVGNGCAGDFTRFEKTRPSREEFADFFGKTRFSTLRRSRKSLVFGFIGENLHFDFLACRHFGQAGLGA